MNGPLIAPPFRLAAPIGALVVWAAFGLATWAGAGQEQPSAPRGSRVAELKLNNGSMEQGDAMPLGWQKGAAVPGVRYVWDKAVGHDSKASLRLHKTVQRYFPIAQWHQFVPNPKATSKLTVSAWVKAERATKGIVDVLFFGQDGKMTHQWIAYIGAKNANEPPVTHDWKEYTGIVEIPPGTTRLGVALQIYGPGKIWFDDVRAEFVPDETPKTDAVQAKGRPRDDVADIPAQDLTVDGNGRMRYCLIGPRENAVPPKSGFKLVVVMPGGDGGEDFHPFVRRIYKHAMNDEFLVAQPVAFKWRPLQKIVWPTRINPVEGQEFSTEDFVEAVVRDAARRYSLDERCVFTLSWSSSGPAAYAISLAEKKSITGSYVAMSVFQPDFLPPLTNARGHAYFIDHSPDDRTCPFRMAKAAEQSLQEHGASVRLNTYEGGHGWRGDVYGRIRSGIDWLEKHTASDR